jgi:hypothetical protein
MAPTISKHPDTPNRRRRSSDETQVLAPMPDTSLYQDAAEPLDKSQTRDLFFIRGAQ